MGQPLPGAAATGHPLNRLSPNGYYQRLYSRGLRWYCSAGAAINARPRFAAGLVPVAKAERWEVGMRTRTRWLALVVVASVAVVAVLSVRPAVAESTSTVYQASVSYMYPPGECPNTGVSIRASTFEGGQIDVSLYEFDCDGNPSELSRTGFGPLSAGDFRISPDLKRAWLDTTVMACYDGYPPCTEVDIHLVWHASGPTNSFTLPDQFCDGNPQTWDGTLFVTQQPATLGGRVKIDGQQTLSREYTAQMEAHTTVCP
jgi:hypothetical protein